MLEFPEKIIPQGTIEKVTDEENTMISFESDYTTGAHPAILKKLMETNLEPAPGYGSDRFTQQAIEKIRRACECPDAQVYLAAGGTQTNQLVISAMLRSYEGVVAAETGHVSAHEAGAIEYSGHKVLTVPGHMGKMDAGELKAFLEGFYADGNHEHMVFPGMVYISFPTEYGSLYSRKELEELHGICADYGIPLYIDGARLSYGLTSSQTDVTMADIAGLSDVFYIGGTKVGALCGEAIVFTKGNMPEHFLTMAKQRGALLAKGRLLGIQFDVLFTDDLYLENGRHANRQKDKMVAVLKRAGLPFYYESPTNQQFVILENERLKEIEKEVAVSFWEAYDEHHTVVRLAASWSTTEEDLEILEQILTKK